MTLRVFEPIDGYTLWIIRRYAFAALLEQLGRTNHNGRKMHCPAGHPYDDVNTYRYRGRRYCRACGRTRARRGPAA